MFFCCSGDSGRAETVEVDLGHTEIVEGKLLKDDQEVRATTEHERVNESIQVKAAPVEVKTSTHFTVTLEKSEKHKSVGLSIDRLDTRLLQVVNVPSDGLISAYNATASADRRILPGFFILSVNSTGGDVQSMITELRFSPRLTLEIAPKLEFDVTLKKGGTPLLVDLSYQPDSACLLVKKVGDGLLKAYNEAMADRSKRVRQGDRIMEVNGLRAEGDLGASKLVEMLKASDEVTLKVTRPMP